MSREPIAGASAGCKRIPAAPRVQVSGSGGDGLIARLFTCVAPVSTGVDDCGANREAVYESATVGKRRRGPALFGPRRQEVDF